MRRVVLDTSVFVNAFRPGGDDLEAVRRHWLFHLSAVVLSELARGADALGDRRLVADLERNFPPVAPTVRQWRRCGELLRRVRVERSFDERGLRAIQNDLLIALTAHELGAALVTSDLGDFRMLAGLVPGLVVVDAATGQPLGS